MYRKLFILTSFLLALALVSTNLALGDVIEVRIDADDDDMEEYVSNGRHDLASSDLEITEEDEPANNQLIGLRFNNIDIPQGAIITSAYVQFHVDEIGVPGDNRPGTKFLRGEAVDNAATFTNTAFDIASRPTTSVEASWDWPEWLTENEEGPDQRTSDIAAVIQEIVDRPGWSAGNSLALIITGSGENCAEAFEGEADAAPLLHIEYIIEPAKPGTDGLVAYYPLENDVLDASGNGNDGTLEDGPTFVYGQFGQALAFEDNRVAISASDSLTADLFQGSFTLSVWINPTQTGYMWQQIFRSMIAADISNDTLFINNDGRLSWRGRIGGAWAGGMCETAPDVVPAGQWTHVAVTGDGTYFRIYVNGALSQESAFQITDGMNATYYIGGDPTWTTESYRGMIDDVRIYNMALTELEILAAMEGEEFDSAPAALPQGWQSRDIGTMYGSAAEIDGIWAVSGNGDDIWYKSDQFHFAYTRLSGDGMIIARVADNGTGSDTWAKGGVMIRETLNQNSKHAMMAITGGDGGGKAFQHRPVTGESAMSAHGGYQVAPPLWVKLTRVGNIFTGYYSFDGVHWIEQENWNLDGGDMAQNPATIEMARDVYIGLFVTSHRSGEIRTYTFDNVSVTELPAPGSAHIILVTEEIDWDLDGLRDDHSLETFLISEGYSVDIRPNYWNVLTPDKIAELNAADLIIVSRLAWSSRYNQDSETSDWNSLTTPLLLMNPNFARNTRWKWVNSWAGAPTDNAPYIYAEIVDPLHPIFIDMQLSSYDPDGLPNVVQIIDPLVGTGLTSFMGTTDMGNGQLIAKSLELDMGWIAEWDVGVEFFDGAGQYAGGRRMLFCAGTQEIQYYDYDRQEVITTAQGELNLTAEGLQMFRNAINYLLGSTRIILVTEEIDWDLDGLRDDHSLESFLISEGYNVDIRPDYWKVLTPDKIVELNAADLIIVSRLAWSSHYYEGNETTDWNSLKTPLLQMNAHFAQNVRWKWVNSWAGTPDDAPYIYAEAVDLLHPIFIDMLLSSYAPAGRPDVVQMIDPLIGTGLTTFIGSTDMGNGRLIAKPLELDMGWIAEWNPGVEFFEGAGQYAGGRRMLFCAGTQEIQYYDYDRQEVITTAQGELNLTAEGLRIFRNAIDYLLNPEFPKVIIEPSAVSIK